MQLGLTRSDVLGPLESDVDGPPISEIELQSSLVSKVRAGTPAAGFDFSSFSNSSSSLRRSYVVHTSAKRKVV